MLAIPGWYAEIKRETIAFIKHLVAEWGGQCTSTFLIGVGGNDAKTEEHKKVRGTSKELILIIVLVAYQWERIGKTLFVTFYLASPSPPNF